MVRKTVTGLVIAALAVAWSAVPGDSGQENPLEGFVSLFDGRSLDGWRKLSEYSGEDGSWIVSEGAVVGDQFPEGKGGLLITERTYGDYELYAEVKADYPIDSGLFLRVQPNVLSYQITIDYRPDGEVGAIYCPGGGGFLVHYPEGQDLWNKNDFNTVLVRIEGQPPRIQAWINGTKIQDFTDVLFEGRPRVPLTGFIGIQVHPGSSWGQGNKVYFRKLLVKPLGRDSLSPRSARLGRAGLRPRCPVSEGDRTPEIQY